MKKNMEPPIPLEELGTMQKLCLVIPALERLSESTACTLPASDEGHSVASSGSCSVDTHE